MQLRHDQLGIIGDRGTGVSLRVELAVEQVGGRSVCVPLHDEATVGSFARVFPGRLRQGNFRLAVAVKVQRDSSLTREKSESVAAKFDTERAAYLRAQGPDPSPRLELPIVRFYDVTPDPAAATCA